MPGIPLALRIFGGGLTSPIFSLVFLSARSVAVHGHLGLQLGCLPRQRPHLRLVVSPLFLLLDQPPELLAVLYGVQGFLPLLRYWSVSLFADNTTALVLLEEPRRHSFFAPQFSGSGCLTALRRSPSQVSSAVHSGSSEHHGELPQSEWTLCLPAFRDLLLLWPATIDLFAMSLNHRLPVYFSPVDDPQSAGTDAMMQPWDGLQAYAFLPFGLLQLVIAKVRQSRGLELTLVAPFMASTPLVSGPSGASGGCPSVPSTSERSTQTVSLPSFPPETPRASADCVSYIERSARTSDSLWWWFACCRCSSTRVNYQAKWAVYRAWCSLHGHSVSRPAVPKVASFLLYLRCSLSLSYPSIASYRSMLSVVFRFVLPELFFSLCASRSPPFLPLGASSFLFLCATLGSFSCALVSAGSAL